MSDQYKCGICKESDLSKFSTRIMNGRRYPRTCCRTCENKKRVLRRQRQGITNSKAYQTSKAKTKLMRKLGINVARFILWDSTRSDRKKGLRNNLDRPFIENCIREGCSYCNETKLRMTLDRIDNAKGHTKNNVVAACIRCNYARGAMPHEAWLCLISGMKKARVSGFFGNWTGRLR